MTAISPQEMASRLKSEGFALNAPVAEALSDPIVDTPMVVTLDQLRPYSNNPRITRNPAYDEIKDSIRARGLDAPPVITRRPGEEHFFIRNGGNTRLEILNALWQETQEERFWRVPCLFRPWTARGEILALTGHLAENEVRGALTFIERALGVDKARTFYEAEKGHSLTQAELAQSLSADGYPVGQASVSRMQTTVQHFLPAIPKLLYAGLGRDLVGRLLILRRAGLRSWRVRASNEAAEERFDALFKDVLSTFDGALETFSVERVQDELIGQMSDLLGAEYNALALDIDDADALQRVLTSQPTPPEFKATPWEPPEPLEPAAPEITTPPVPVPAGYSAHMPFSVKQRMQNPETAKQAHAQPETKKPAPTPQPAETPPGRVETIQKMVEDALGDEAEPANRPGGSTPIHASDLYPMDELWASSPEPGSPENLRVQIAQIAQEIAAEASVDEEVVTVDDGIGFICNRPLESLPDYFAADVLALLGVLSGDKKWREPIRLDALFFGFQSEARLSDEALLKLFRLLLLARQLVDSDQAAMLEQE
ncbi:MAG: hypothetical protein LBP99_02385 [Azoarcus sp.]|jgi:ParB family protein of integrating conjugative element (PFGI_1 class)|nr:hypothetical protein [Azoarcus sp.]